MNLFDFLQWVLESPWRTVGVLAIIFTTAMCTAAIIGEIRNKND